MPSLFQKITFENKNFIVMRDDLNHPIFSGNKARKLAYILNNPQRYSSITTIVSFGGNQSNFMLALSQLAKLKGWKFEYWTKPLPKFLKSNKNGNLKLALDNGMNLFEVDNNLNLKAIKEKYNNKENMYFFDQGGRNHLAEEGIRECAIEINKYCKQNNLKNFSVVIASGTGTTALYLEKILKNKVYTVPCVGDKEYLEKQFNYVDSNLNHPEILNSNFKTNLGQLDMRNYDIYKDLLKQTDIEFDLLYDPIAWRILIKNYDQLPKPIIYIHCGGTSGNISMINRYKRLIGNTI